MKKIKYILIVALMLPIINACNYLDVVPDNIATIDNVFRDRNSAESYLYTCYSFMPAHNNTQANPGNMLSDEFANNKLNWATNRTITETGNNASNPMINYWDGSKSMFTGIRCCNLFLEQIDNIPDISAEEALRWKAEANFLKAYYHWYLFSLYGPIPIIDNNLSINASADDMKVYREPVDKVVDYIVATIDAALPDLPSDLTGKELTEIGRITRPAAMAIKARVLVTAASPLFNGNADYNTFKDNRGLNLFPTGDAKIEKWQRAATACKEAIDACEASGLGLYHFGGVPYSAPAGLKINDSIRYEIQPAMIFGEITANNEAIWLQTNVTAGQSTNIPQALFTGIVSSTTLYGASNAYPWESPSLNSAELFYSKDGVPIDEDSAWVNNGWFNDRFKVDPNYLTRQDHRFYIKQGYQTAIFHLNRESRYYGSLGFDGANWFGFGVTDVNNQYFVKDFNGSYTNPLSGFYNRKFVPYKTVMDAKTPGSIQNGITYWSNSFPIMRMADLYLLYAEALNEVDPSTTNPDILKYVDMVRERANLKGVAYSWNTFALPIYKNKYANQAGMRQIIQRERMIELAFEGQGGFDRRRWKMMDKLLAKGTIRGFATVKNETLESYLTPDVLWATDFKFRDYFWPIKTSNLQVNTNLVQNPGW